MIARKDPARHSRAAARWLRLYLEKHAEATIEVVPSFSPGRCFLIGALPQQR
jgi:hypothetical protein